MRGLLSFSKLKVCMCVYCVHVWEQNKNEAPFIPAQLFFIQLSYQLSSYCTFGFLQFWLQTKIRLSL